MARRGWSAAQRAAYDAAKKAGKSQQEAFAAAGRAGRGKKAGAAPKKKRGRRKSKAPKAQRTRRKKPSHPLGYGGALLGPQKKPKAKRKKRKPERAHPITVSSKTRVPVLDRKGDVVLSGRLVTGQRRDQIILSKLPKVNTRSARVLRRMFSGKGGKRPPAVVVSSPR